MTLTLIIIVFTVALDRLFADRGAVRLWAWYEEWAQTLEQRFNAGSRAQGVMALVVAVAPVVFAVFIIRYVLSRVNVSLVYVFDILVLYLCLDLYRLARAASAVSESLESGDVAAAASYLEALTLKPLADATEPAIAQATVEAVLKQGNAAVMAPLFWFILLGPVAAVLQRLAAVLDRLWGHRSAQYAEFGWAAARLDDVLGWVPARITALSYGIMGSFEDALHCWRRQAGMWSDINSGPLLASGFGAMHISQCAEPEDEDVPDAHGAQAMLVNAADIRRVVALLWRVLLFWLAVAVLMAGARLFGVFG